MIIRFLLSLFGIKPIEKHNFDPNITTPKKGLEIVDLIKETPSTRVDKSLSHRRNGHTTRIADRVVQRFFESKKNEQITYGDHYLESRSGDDNLRNIIERRLIEEHRLKQNEDFFSSYNKNSNILIKKF